MKSSFRLAMAALVLLTETALSQTSTNVQVVGQNALFNRDMNGAATIFKNFLYVGNRPDGSSRCGLGNPRRTVPKLGKDACPHVHPGILILSITDPTNPTVVGEIPAPQNTSGQACGYHLARAACLAERKVANHHELSLQFGDPCLPTHH